MRLFVVAFAVLILGSCATAKPPAPPGPPHPVYTHVTSMQEGIYTLTHLTASSEDVIYFIIGDRVFFILRCVKPEGEFYIRSLAGTQLSNERHISKTDASLYFQAALEQLFPKPVQRDKHADLQRSI